MGVIVNDSWRGTTKLSIGPGQPPCLTAPLLQEWGVRYDKLPSFTFSDQGCVLSQSLASHAIRRYYVREAQLLTLIIPPALLNHIANGIATSRWDDGINAIFADYDISYSHYAGLAYARPYSLDIDILYGVNLGPWRFRYEPVYSKDPFSNPRWHTERATSFRTVRSLRSLLTLGDNTTSANVFDSVDYRGISLATDDRMLPDELRPLSSWIRGFARTESEVKIRQYGTVIYQTTVPAGSFVLKDIYPADPSADIEMTVKEEDGTETVRIIPYSAMPNLVRSGQSKFAVALGKYRPYYLLDEQEPFFSQATLSYGVAEDSTLYGGVMLSGLYRSAVSGVGRRFARWGALSMDFSVAEADDPRYAQADRGTMARLRYARAFADWASSVSLTAQYYPKQRYRTFSEAVSQQTRYWWDWEDGRFVGEVEAEKKNRLAFSYVQNFSEEDDFYLTLIGETLRGKKKRTASLEAGYTGSWGAIDYSLYFSYERPQGEKELSQLNFSLALPLALFGLPHSKLNLEKTLTKNGAASRKVGLSGTALEDYSLSYNLSNTQEDGASSLQKMSANYQYNAGNLMGIYTRKKQESTAYLGVTGSIVAHQGGITLGQSMGETVALVEVPQTSGVGIINQYGTTTDSHGYAVIGNLTPFRVNELMLDTLSLGAVTEVVPTAGAIMDARFKAPEELTP